MRGDFWKTTGELLRFKRLLIPALGGAVISGACFGAGLAMLYPIFTLFFSGEGAKGQNPLPQLVNDKLLATDSPDIAPAPWRVELAQHITDLIPQSLFASFVTVLSAVLVLTLIGSFGRYLHELLTITAVQRLAMIWRGRLFDRMLFAPLGALGEQEEGSGFASRLIVDINVLIRGQLAILSKAVAEVIKGASALCVALLLDWVLTLLALIAAPLIVIWMRKFGKVIKRASRRALREQAAMVKSLHSVSVALPVIKTQNAEAFERRRFSRLNRRLFAEQMAMRQARALAGPVIETLALVGVLVTATIAAWFFFGSNTEPQRFALVMLSLAAAGASLKPLTGIHIQIKESDAAATRIMQGMQLPLEPVQFKARRDRPKLARHRRDVRFEQVFFTYDPLQEDALRDVDITIPFGRTTAIVGANGSGKSTLMSLLPRLYQPQAGRVLIDGTDIATVNLRSLREQIAMVSQQTILFEGTIAENIAYARPLTPPARIEQAARLAGAHEFISQLPHGYDSLLGEAGEGLSGGQRQRLAIARAILSDPSILILDEATSQIDADSEARISQALRKLRRGRTTFIIAHRLSTVIDADQILVMDAGRIIDRGTHHELLGRCPTYQVLTRSQLQPPAA
ncbi:MAG: ABC transporter ATP-binding protein [Phycisphaeraceae bacterium]|nr:ABC transporter ATP-binding protein [Phycisphaeraceae bacterium]